MASDFRVDDEGRVWYRLSVWQEFLNPIGFTLFRIFATALLLGLAYLVLLFPLYWEVWFVFASFASFVYMSCYRGITHWSSERFVKYSKHPSVCGMHIRQDCLGYLESWSHFGSGGGPVSYLTVRTGLLGIKQIISGTGHSCTLVPIEVYYQAHLDRIFENRAGESSTSCGDDTNDQDPINPDK